MQLLAENLERQVVNQMRKGMVVWLDKDGLYNNFVDSLAERRARGEFFGPVLRLRGSFLELLLEQEPYMDGLDSEPLLLHVPGHTDSSIRETPLLEAYKAGTRFERALTTLVKEVSVGHVAPTEVERFLDEEPLNFEKAEEWLNGFLAQERGGLEAQLAAMKPEVLLHSLLSNLGPVISNEECGALKAYMERHCGVSGEYVRVHLGEGQHTARGLIDAWLGWLMCVEYVSDLKRKPSLEVLQPLSNLSAPIRKACLELLENIRQKFPEQYRRLANETEVLIEADLASGTPDELGKIDTFSREDSRLLEAAVEALDREDWKRAYAWAEERLSKESVWLTAEPLRRQEWKLVRVAADLGRKLAENPAPLKGAKSLSEAVERYSEKSFEVDLAHRLFEQDRLRWLAPQLVHFNGLLQATANLRRHYHNWVDALNRAFSELCDDHGFLPEPSLQQRTLYDQVVHPLVQRNKGLVAYFLVDGLRYEMAAELSGRLLKSGLTQRLTPRLAELPSVTKVGMNVLAPVSRDGHLTVNGAFAGFKSGEYVVNNPEQRLRAMGDRSLENLAGNRRSPAGLTLQEVHKLEPKDLKKRIGKLPLVVVHSREIDSSGESDLGIATFETWLGQLHSAISVLRHVGAEHFVITSDHGFLLLDESREPLEVSNDRRFFESDAMVTRDGMTSVSTSSLAYDGGSAYLVFPRDASTFRSKGQTAQTFVHGGNSLQERVIPVLTLNYSTTNLTGLGQYSIEAKAMKPVVGYSRLQVKLVEGERPLLGYEDRKLAVALRVVDPADPNIRVSCKQVDGGELVHQQLILKVGADWTEVIFRLEGGTVERAAIELYHPDRAEKIEPFRLKEFFDVHGATPLNRSADGPASRGGASLNLEGSLGGTYPAVSGEPVPTTTPKAEVPKSYTDAWADNIQDPGVRAVLLEIEEASYIDEDLVIKKLGTPRAARQFALKFESYFKYLPFEIRIDSQGGQKRYIKKG